jgi:UDP-2,4-diacetamido-2,4,6-trideoxy-beta-L-altropyranose hydrolase
VAPRTRVLLRADAAGDIGVGHVKRCLSLGQALIDCGAEVSLLTHLHDVDTAAIARQAGIECIALPLGRGDDWMADALATSARAASHRSDWVVVDHYKLDARWHRQVARTGARIAAIDDLADRPLEAAVLIDQNEAEHRSKYVDVLPSLTPLLGGPRFAMLSRAYADAPRWRDRGAVRSIGIFMGGTDAAGMSEVALQACREAAGFDGEIQIATTSGNARLALLKRLCELDRRTSLLIDASDLTEFFAEHDIQVGAGGGATWERCCLGVPTLLLRCAPNQDVVIPALVQRGVVRGVAAGLDRNTAAVGAAVQKLIDDAALRRELSRRALETVDGLGARRIALFIAAETLQVRPARQADGELLHRWRNHLSTRMMSVDSREIEMEEHLRWFARALQVESRQLLIAQVGNIAVGSIRFDRLADGAQEVSLYLDPALHGLRLGTWLLARGERYISDSVGTQVTFVATVLPENLGSRRLFAASGYHNIGDRWLKTAVQHKDPQNDEDRNA